MKIQSDKIKVLFLPRWYPVSADSQRGVFVKRHAEAVALYAEVVVLYIESDPDLRDSYSVIFNNKKIKEFLIFFKKDKSVFCKIINFFRYIKAVQIGFKYLVKNNFVPDICHIHILTRTALLALYYKIFKGKPYVITEHWTGYTSGLYSQWPAIKKFIHKQILLRSSGITAVSKSLGKTLSNITLKDTCIIPNVLADDFKFSLPKNNDKTVILTVADLDDRKKNVSAIIQVLGEIYSFRKDFEYHIIGGGYDFKFLKNLAEKSFIKQEVAYFHGEQPNSYVAQFIREVDFVVINSNFETFCVIAIEALASGKPVIATRSGGPEEFMREDYGILINPRDSKALKNAILYMLDHWRNYDGEKMSRSIKNRYCKESVGKQFIQLYSTVLGNNNTL